MRRPIARTRGGDMVTIPMGGSRLRILAVVTIILLAGGACATQTLHRAGSAAAGATSFTVCLDPGHPSEVSDGRALLNGLREVEVVFDVATRLRRLLEAEGIHVVMTKQSVSEMVTNRGRAEIANRCGAAFMLRIHTDAGGGKGFTFFVPRKQGTAKDGTRGPAQKVIDGSVRLGGHFHTAFAAAIGAELRNNGIRGDEQSAVGRRQGALTGSIFCEVPTILIEMLFLSDRGDAAWIASDDNRTSMAAALARGCLAVRDELAKPAPPAAR